MSFDECLKIRRALLSVSDKAGIVELAQALSRAGAELVATGNTARLLQEAGLPVTPIEKISGSPEAFRGRMKTLSFPVCSGILYRRGDPQDESDLEKLHLVPIDCVVVNFYPFEAVSGRYGILREELIEEVDIGGPTLVRAAAKNVPDVLVLTNPAQYGAVISELKGASGGVSRQLAGACAAEAWEAVLNYDQAIARQLGARERKHLRYGENPHQHAYLEVEKDSPVVWGEHLTLNELSYNNILDFSSAYPLVSDLVSLDPNSTAVVIVKHNNPCGVAVVPKSHAGAQTQALLHAWTGDPVSAFGGVVLFSDPLEASSAQWLSERFVELVAAPHLSKEDVCLQAILKKRKNLKAISVLRWGIYPKEAVLSVPGGKLYQTPDTGVEEALRSVTETSWQAHLDGLARFGILVNRTLKSNSVSLVREIRGVRGGYQLIGAGQGQPNRVEALERLAIPRAVSVVKLESGKDGGAEVPAGILKDCVLVSDAFFPFRDTVDVAARAGIRAIVQPGGSIKDAESIAACNEHGISMVFTGVRHFRH